MIQEQELSERKLKILQAIIKNYLENRRAGGFQNNLSTRI